MVVLGLCLLREATRTSRQRDIPTCRLEEEGPGQDLVSVVVAVVAVVELALVAAAGDAGMPGES
eukprot:COSAG02_NODE_5839_length_3997_cov_5.153412_5_plen_64_part_00